MVGVRKDNGSNSAWTNWFIFYGDVWQAVEFEVEWQEEMIAYLFDRS